jgi:hypothetical protein
VIAPDPPAWVLVGAASRAMALEGPPYQWMPLCGSCCGFIICLRCKHPPWLQSGLT